jgi:hypothetical protein
MINKINLQSCDLTPNLSSVRASQQGSQELGRKPLDLGATHIKTGQHRGEELHQM